MCPHLFLLGIISGRVIMSKNKYFFFQELYLRSSEIDALNRLAIKVGVGKI